MIFICSNFFIRRYKFTVYRLMWPTRLYYAACSNIRKLCIYYKNYKLIEEVMYISYYHFSM